MYPIINIFGRQVGSYALCTLLGLIVCTVFATRFAKKYKLYFEDIILIMLVIAAGLIIGGHILYFLTNINGFLSFLTNESFTFKQFLSKVMECGGGMVFYGGFIGALIALAIYLRIAHKENKDLIMNLFSVSVPLFHTFGRIGCFFGGCCYGIESKWGIIITDNILYPAVNGVRRLPVSLIEAGANFLLLVFLLVIFKRTNGKISLIYVYMFFYSIIRFTLEFFRGDEIRGIFYGLSTSQWISIILFTVSSAYFVIKHLKSNKKQWNKITHPF